MSSDQIDPADPANPFAPPGNSTSASNLLTVALRILGFWLVCRSLIMLPSMAVYAMHAFRPSSPLGIDPISMVLTVLLQLVLPLVVGIGLILLAGRISRRFYPASYGPADSITFGAVGAGDLYYIASFMMGVYMLSKAVAPGVRFLAGTMGAAPFAIEPWTTGGVNDMIAAAVYSVSGLVLIFGGPGIAQAMAAVPRESDEVPVPQFSIRMLLILGVAFAIVLGVLRAVLVGIR